MATREENLKKINLKLEKMTDEELDQVAGGTYNNTAADSRILNKMGFKIEGKSALNCFWIPTFHKTASEVANIFDRFGISLEQSWGAVSNKYFKDGKEISREEAFKHVADKIGKPMPDIDY